MASGRLVATPALVLALALAAALAAGCGSDSDSDADAVAAPPLTLAVIGDTPYGPEQERAFPRLVDAIDHDADVDLVLHLGDIKTGGSSCAERRFSRLLGLLNSFADPLVYTPGDNEWTDCHRVSAGGHVPTGRLAILRRLFYPQPGMSLGRRPRTVTSQASAGGRFGAFVENVMWTEREIVFATLHVVGSNNDRAPWFDGRETAGQRSARRAEFAARLAADLAWLDATFDAAARGRAPVVVLAMQADMFPRGSAGGSGFTAIVERLTARATSFDGAVLLLNGDTHRFLSDRPLPDAPNVSRIVVEGETAAEWLRLSIDPQSPTFFSLRRHPVQ